MHGQNFNQTLLGSCLGARDSDLSTWYMWPLGLGGGAGKAPKGLNHADSPDPDCVKQSSYVVCVDLRLKIKIVHCSSQSGPMGPVAVI